MLDPTVVGPHFVVAEDQNLNPNTLDMSPELPEERHNEMTLLEPLEMEQLIHTDGECDEGRKERAFDLLLWLMNLELRLPPYPAEFQIA